MRIHGFTQLRRHPCLPTEEVHRFTRQGLGPIVAWEEPGPRCIPPPRLPEQGQQPRREPPTAIALAFPLPDAEDHARTIDIGDLEVTEFRDAQAGRREGRQNGTRFEAAGSWEQGRHFGLTQDRREGLRPLGLRDVGEHVALAERNIVEKAQGTDGLHHECPRDMPLVDEIELILAHLLGAEPIRRGPEVLGKLGDTAERGLASFWGRVPQLEVIAHPLAQGGQRGTDGLHGSTPSIERAVSWCGIYATPRMEESLWSRETTDGQRSPASDG